VLEPSPPAVGEPPETALDFFTERLAALTAG
jgi:hypothetical protein